MKQYKHRNFYTHDLTSDLQVLFSYNTCVGFRYYDCVFYTPNKYSVTTSKQQTQFANENKLKRYTLPNNDMCRNFLTTNIYTIIDNLNFVKANA